MWCPVYKQRDFHLSFDTELENLIGGGKGKGTSGSPARPKVPIRRSGTDCLVLALKRGNARGAKGAGHSVMINLVNRQREEPTGCGGGRQLSMDGTSRVTGDSHARICERLGVKIPGATRRAISDGRPYRDTWRPAAISDSIRAVSAHRIHCTQVSSSCTGRRLLGPKGVLAHAVMLLAPSLDV